MKRMACALAFVAAFASLCFAQSWQGKTSFEFEGDYSFPNLEATDASGLVPIEYGVVDSPLTGQTEARQVGSSWGGGQAKAILDNKFAYPMFAGDNPLTKDNNLAIDLSTELSPVSINENFKLTLTPIAFLTFDAGMGFGTGWDIGFVGLGIRDSIGNVEPQDFGGLVYRTWFEGTFQFDLAALWPGDWHHIVAVVNDKIEYQGYTGAANGTPWIWEADDGMDFNGWQLYGSYFLGYQMPLVLDTVGLLLQTQGYLGSVASMSAGSSGGWGSDFTQLTFGPLLDLTIDKKSTIAILPQFQTGLRWTAQTEWLTDFTKRQYQEAYLYFYRIAFDYNLKL